MKSITIIGHNILVTKCVKNEKDYLVGDIENAKPINTTVCDIEADMMIRSNWCKVQGIGPKCGTKRSNMSQFKTRDNKYTICRWYHNSVGVGDFVIIPEMPTTTSTFSCIDNDPNVFFIDESDIRIILKNGKIIPFGRRVLVEEIPEKSEEGGIIFSDNSKDRPKTGIVRELGEANFDSDGRIVPFCVKVGDKILISKFDGISVDHNDIKYRLLNENDIIAIL